MWVLEQAANTLGGMVMGTASEVRIDRGLRRLVMLVGAIVLVDTMFFSAVTPLLPHYARELGLSKAGAGFLSACYAIGTGLGAIPSGILAARLGTRRTVFIGLAGMSVTSVVFGVAHTVWLLDAARFVQGFSGACSWTGALAWLVAFAPSERRGELIGTALAAAIGGSLLGPVLGGVASVVGTEVAFPAVAVLGLGLAVAAARTPSRPVGERQPLRKLVTALRQHYVIAGMWFTLLPGLLFGTLAVLGPLRLSKLGMSGAEIGATFLVAAGIESALSPALGRWSDRRGRLAPIRAGLWASALAALLLPFADNQWLLAGIVIGAAASFGAFWAPAFSLLAHGAEQEGLDHGYGFALMNLAWAPGQAIGAGLGGAIAAATADAVPYGALAVVCAITLVMLALRPRS